MKQALGDCATQKRHTKKQERNACHVQHLLLFWGHIGFLGK
jgi:hypothetical protein